MTVASAVPSGSSIAGKTQICVEDNARYSSTSENADGRQLEVSAGGGETEDSWRADCAVAGSGCGDAVAVGARFLFFLIKLRTVSDGWAPLPIQYSARSTFNELLLPGVFGSYVPMISINFPSRGLRLSATTIL